MKQYKYKYNYNYNYNYNYRQIVQENRPAFLYHFIDKLIIESWTINLILRCTTKPAACYIRTVSTYSLNPAPTRNIPGTAVQTLRHVTRSYVAVCWQEERAAASAIASQVWWAVLRASIQVSGAVSRDGRVVDLSVGVTDLWLWMVGLG